MAQSVTISPSTQPAARPAPRRTAIPRQATIIRSRDESGRARTRIVVQRRSYLDAGTEVLPGERKYRDYVALPGHSPTGFMDNTPFSRGAPMMGPFDLPGQNNPFQ